MLLGSAVSIFLLRKESHMQTPLPYTPFVMEETFAGIQSVDARDHMLANRKLELTGPIDEASSSALVRSLLFLQESDPHKPATLYINSPGGEVHSGLALYDVMQAVSFPVHTVCVGMAASMAAIIFVSGSERSMLPHSMVMIHDPLIDGGLGGSALSVKAKADTLMRTRDITASILAHHTGLSTEKVLELTSKDTYFDAEEAIQAGISDHIARSL